MFSRGGRSELRCRMTGTGKSVFREADLGGRLRPRRLAHGRQRDGELGRGDEELKHVCECLLDRSVRPQV